MVKISTAARRLVLTFLDEIRPWRPLCCFSLIQIRNYSQEQTSFRPRSVDMKTVNREQASRNVRGR